MLVTHLEENVIDGELMKRARNVKPFYTKEKKHI